MTSDLAAIKAWWRRLDGDGFLALPPPTRNRYTQSDGHDDAAESISAEALADATSFAYWHWQSHERAFGRAGELIGRLYLHWGGDHDVVRAALGPGPDGYRLVDNGPQGAFELDRLTVRDADGLPRPDDQAAVRQLLDDLAEPLDRTRWPFEYRPLTAAEEAWLHERLAAPGDLDAHGTFLNALRLRSADRADEAERLLDAGRAQHAGDLTDYRHWRTVLQSALRHDLDQAWDVVAALGPRAVPALDAVPSERSLAMLRALALDGDADAAGAWLAAYADVRDADPYRAAAAVGVELEQSGASAEVWQGVFQRLFSLTAVRHDGADRPDHPGFGLPGVWIALDERLPHDLRALAARESRNAAAVLREALADAGPDEAVVPGHTASRIAAALDRFEKIAPALTAGSGPVLTGSEGRLRDAWADYRDLSPADIGWLHAQVADPATELQGFGFCLELLYAHGEGTQADIDALRPRWKKEMTKKYETTYTEWRHPLVVLTCLAHELGDPLAADLDKWWATATPKWKQPLRLLTLLGQPTEEHADELLAYIASGEHDTGHLMTWVLMRARLDGDFPLDIADGLLGSQLRPFVLHRVLLGVADPDQPLWHYDIGVSSLSWWHRIVVVAEDANVSSEARAVALEAARGHRIITSPDQMRGVSAADIAAAKEWLAAQ